MFSTNTKSVENSEFLYFLSQTAIMILDECHARGVIMELVHRFISSLLLGTLIFIFYQKIISLKNKKSFLVWIIPLVFAIYTFFSHANILEPLRTMLGILILGVSFLVWKRSINWAALILAFLFGYSASIISLLIGTAVNLLGRTAPIWILYLLVDIAVYIIFYKTIKLKNGIPLIEEKEVKGIIFAIGGIILAAFGGYHITISRIYELNAPLFYTALVVLAGVILALAILIAHLSRKHKERLEMERQLCEVEAAFGELGSQHHKYRDAISAMGGSYYDLVKNILDKDTSHGENFKLHVETFKKYLDSMDSLAAEMGAEFAIDDVNNTVAALQLPDEWYPLKNRLRQLMGQCQPKEIAVFSKNTAPDEMWESLTVSKLDFIRIVGNLIGNAIKELEKSNPIGKQVMFDFLDDKGVFVFVVRDNAHQFPLDILVRLGERKNSTNGTGDGYAEIFEILNTNNATFEMTERKENEKNRKIIRILFDGKNQRIIRTGYRYEELKTALAGTAFEVERLA